VLETTIFCLYRLADIEVKPDYTGLPPNLERGLIHLTNNAAGLLMLISGAGIAISLVAWVLASWAHSHEVSQRAKHGLAVSAASGALLYLGVMAANYATGLFR